MRVGYVYFDDRYAGVIAETEEGFSFAYDEDYANDPNAKAVSLTLPLRLEPYESKTMFPFFDGLIPEGWLLDLSLRNWKLSAHDRMGLLLSCCHDSIGAVSVWEEKR